jgi:hypothetical protein
MGDEACAAQKKKEGKTYTLTIQSLAEIKKTAAAWELHAAPYVRKPQDTLVVP